MTETKKVAALLFIKLASMDTKSANTNSGTAETKYAKSTLKKLKAAVCRKNESSPAATNVSARQPKIKVAAAKSFAK